MHCVTIHNFQSHKDTVLELSPTVNSLEGVSDSGKSAVLRAMLWCLTNKPDGVAFASNWAKDKKGKLNDEVSVSIDNITRTRTASVNGYVKHVGPDAISYEALKGTVPPDIENAINLGSVNIQRQMDPPFLLASTPGDAARYVNELVGLEEIDVYQKALKGKSHDNATSLKDATKRLSDAEASLAQYAWVDEAKGKVSDLEAVTSQCNALNNDLAALATLDEAARLSADLADTSLYVGRVEALISGYPATESMQRELDQLDHALDTIRGNAVESWKEAVARADGMIAELSASKVPELSAELSALDEGLRNYTAVYNELTPAVGILPSLDAFIQEGSSILASQDSLAADVRSIAELEQVVHAIESSRADLAEAEKFLEGKACPVCGRPL